MPTKPSVAIIILHFGKWQTTKECLDSLTKITYPNFKAYLVNNSLEIIPNHKIIYQKITPKKNLGYAGGNNFAVQKARMKNFDYYLFLNNDTIVEKDFLDKLIDNLPEKNCLTGPVLEHIVKNKTYYDYGGRINWQKAQATHFNKLNYKNGNPIQRDFVSGCCLLISRKIIEQIGGFREDYFLYLEDVELCVRAAKNNFKTYLIPNAKIFHKGSLSSTEFTKIFYSLKNSLKFAWRYCPLKYKPTAIMFNIIFYPTLFISWRLKFLKNKFKQNKL